MISPGLDDLGTRDQHHYGMWREGDCYIVLQLFVNYAEESNTKLHTNYIQTFRTKCVEHQKKNGLKLKRFIYVCLIRKL